MNIGIVGYGFAGSVLHAPLIARVPGLRVHSVVARDPARRSAAEAQYGARAFSCMEEMLDDGAVQIVVVATPHDTHEALVVEALEAGRHVVCEKVMALTTPSADRMLAAARASGKLLTVFHNRRWDGDFITIRRACQAGLLGRLRFVELAIHTHKVPRTWRNSVERSGGLLYDWGAHLVDQALRLIPGQVVGVSGFSQWMGSDAGRREVHARCHIRFETGQIAAIEVSYASHSGRDRWFVSGERGTLVKDGYDPQEAALRKGRLEDAKEDPAERCRVRAEVAGTTLEARLDTVAGRWLSFYENVRDAVLTGEPLAVTGAEAREVVRVLEAHSRAAREGREVALSELESP